MTSSLVQLPVCCEVCGSIPARIDACNPYAGQAGDLHDEQQHEVAAGLLGQVSTVGCACICGETHCMTSLSQSEVKIITSCTVTSQRDQIVVLPWQKMGEGVRVKGHWHYRTRAQTFVLWV